MKKEMSLRFSMKACVKSYADNVVECFAKMLSFCLDEKVSPLKAGCILHAMIAFTFLVFSHTQVWLSVLFLIWFFLTLLDCKRVGL